MCAASVAGIDISEHLIMKTADFFIDFNLAANIEDLLTENYIEFTWSQTMSARRALRKDRRQKMNIA